MNKPDTTEVYADRHASYQHACQTRDELDLIPMQAIDGSEAGSSAAADHPPMPGVQDPALDSWVVVYASLALFSICGGLTRYGLNLLSSFLYSPVYGTFYANMVGCFIAGLVIATAPLMPRVLALGLMTGLCGSITTFSSWQQEASVALIGWQSFAYPLSWQQGAAWASIVFTGALTSIQAFIFGKLLGRHIMTKREDLHVWYPVRTRHSFCPFGWLETVLVAFAVIAVALAVGAPFSHSNYQLTFTALFAPFGTFLRFKLAKFNQSDGFPRGTFAANMIGTTILSVLTVVEASQNCFTASRNAAIIQGVFFGIFNGFCGCLTTVSSAVAELINRLSVRKALIYGFNSLVFAQLLTLIINGTYVWSSNEQVC